MTIIAPDGRKIEFASPLEGDNVTVDRRVLTDRREFDHTVPEQRVNDRRAKPVKEERKSTAKDWRGNLEGRNIQAWMEDLLSRIELMVGINYTVTHQDGTTEENNGHELSTAARAGA